MTTATYRMLSGETIAYAVPTGPLTTFLRRIERAATDPALPATAMESLIFSSENPLLSTDIISGHAVLTAATIRNPLFHIMLDIICRKRAGVDAAGERERFTMTVGQAAKELGVTRGAIRQAIAARRLKTWKDGGVYYLDPAEVAAYRVSRRGPVPRHITRSGP